MIIPDTSIWIDLLRGNEATRVTMNYYLDNDRIAGLEPIFAELLQGAKTQEEVNEIMGIWSNLNKAHEKNLWLEAGKNSMKNKWHNNGISLIDAFIITVAWKYNYKIWTLDKKLAQAAGEKFIV